MLNTIDILYITKKREKLFLNEGQAVLLIMDVFKVQMINPVLKVLWNNNILLQSVLANCTYLFQPLDVQSNSNGIAKRLIGTLSK